MTHQRLREKVRHLFNEAIYQSRIVGTAETGSEYEEAISSLEGARTEFTATMASIGAELDAARKDAERWRELKREAHEGEGKLIYRMFHGLDTPYWDAAIDAAINADGEKGDE